MTFAIPAFEEQVNYLLSVDNGELDTAARKANIKSAIERYSRDTPDEVTADVTGDGGKYYPVAANLTSWSEGFSRILSIEYPAQAISADDTPQYIAAGDWDDDYWASSVRYLFLPNHAPAATETMRIRYLAPYTLTSNAYDIPPIDFNAVCHLATSLCCQAIATKYARTSDSTLSADSVDHAGRSERFRQQAREWMKLYEEHIGLIKSASGDGGADGGRDNPASDVIDFVAVTGFGSGRLFSR